MILTDYSYLDILINEVKELGDKTNFCEIDISKCDISKIVYRKDDFGVTCFRHIDIECVYGEYIEIPESDRNYKKILDLFPIIDLEKEEVILFERH